MLTEKTDRAWFSRLLRHPAKKRSRSILSTPEPARGGCSLDTDTGIWPDDKFRSDGGRTRRPLASSLWHSLAGQLAQSTARRLCVPARTTDPARDRSEATFWHAGREWTSSVYRRGGREGMAQSIQPVNEFVAQQNSENEGARTRPGARSHTYLRNTTRQSACRHDHNARCAAESRLRSGPSGIQSVKGVIQHSSAATTTVTYSLWARAVPHPSCNAYNSAFYPPSDGK